MKRITIAFTLMVNAFCIYAQNTQVETAIRKLEETEHKAMLARDTGTLLKVWAADFIVNTPANRITLSRQELFNLVRAGIFTYSSFTRDIEQVFIKNDMAITMGSEAVIPVGNSSKEGQVIKRRYTNIWMKQNGAWRLTARHANEICTK